MPGGQKSRGVPGGSVIPVNKIFVFYVIQYLKRRINQYLLFQNIALYDKVKKNQTEFVLKSFVN